MNSWNPLWAALALVGLLIAAIAVVPTAPSVTEGGMAVVAFYREHHDGVALQAWLTMAASIPAAVFVALVMQRMSTPASTVFLLGAATTVSLLAVGVLLLLGLSLHPAGLNPATARTIADIESFVAPLQTFPIVAQAAAIIFAVRARDFPGWIGAISVVLLVEQLAESATVFGHHGFFEPSGAMNSLLGPALYGVWLIALGVAAGRPLVGARERAAASPGLA